MTRPSRARPLPSPVQPSTPPSPAVGPSPGQPAAGVPGALTVAQLLERQPDPVPGVESVTAWLLEHGERVCAPPILAELLVARHAQGLAAYGVELETHNGRSARCDAIQEAVDLLKFLCQLMLERRDRGLPVVAQTRALAEVYCLVVDLATNVGGEW